MKLWPCCLIVVTLLNSACTPKPQNGEAWELAAQAYLKKQNFAPIELPADTTYSNTTPGRAYAWHERVLLQPFRERIKKWPAHEGRAAAFGLTVLRARSAHPETDWSLTPSSLEKEGLALLSAKVDDPLILWATAWLTWEDRKAFDPAEALLAQATKIRALDPALKLEVMSLRHRMTKEYSSHFDTVTTDRLKAVEAALADTDLFQEDDDEMKAAQLSFLFHQETFNKFSKEILKLSEHPRNSPWLKAWLLGRWEDTQGWQARGRGFSNTVTEEGRKAFEKHEKKAYRHFLEAWQLRPDLPHAAASMIDIVRTGHAPKDESLRVWFDRSVKARFDWWEAYYSYAWSLRPRWGGTHEEMLALGYACALTRRYDTRVPEQLYTILDFVAEDAEVWEDVFREMILPEVLTATEQGYAVEPSLIWDRPRRETDLGIYAWAVGNYAKAHEVFTSQPDSFPAASQTKALSFGATETRVRGESAIGAAGFLPQWQQAWKLYYEGCLPESQELAGKIARAMGEGTPPWMKQLLQAIQFEKALASGQWQELEATPDLSGWEVAKGQWSGQQDGSLVMTNTGEQTVILYPGRIQGDFEMVGKYVAQPPASKNQGIGITLGAAITSSGGTWLGLIQDDGGSFGPAATLRDRYYHLGLPRIPVTNPKEGEPWHFHILYRAGKLTYRLNNEDAFYSIVSKEFNKALPVLANNARIGFFHYGGTQGSRTTIRHVKLRRLTAPQRPVVSPNNANTIAELESWLAAHEKAVRTALHEELIVELEQFSEFIPLADDLKRNDDGDWNPSTTLINFSPAGQRILHAYQRSLHERLLHIRPAWRLRAETLRDQAKEHGDPTLAATFDPVIARLTPSETVTQTENLLAPENRWRWQEQAGQWNFAQDNPILFGQGDSGIVYELGKKPPFQLEFQVTVVDGLRTRVHIGPLIFANNGVTTTFSLFPNSKETTLLPYERQKPYEVLIKVTQKKSELFVNGQHVCDGQGVNGSVPQLRFRSGDYWSKGSTKFENIRVSPLP
jgi:hypothetical protein